MVRDLTDVYAAIARYGKHDGLRASVYPAPGALPPSPALIVFGAGASITHGPDQLWSIRVKGHLMVGMVGLTDREILAGHKLIFPLVDRFAADVEDTDGFTLGGLVDRCVVSDVGEDATLGYAGHSYFGNPVFFDVKLHRHAGED